jgi:hypothetical protein
MQIEGWVSTSDPEEHIWPNPYMAEHIMRKYKLALQFLAWNTPVCVGMAILALWLSQGLFSYDLGIKNLAK